MSKRTKRAVIRAAKRSERGKPGKGKSRYALKAAAGPSATSPFRHGGDHARTTDTQAAQ